MHGERTDVFEYGGSPMAQTGEGRGQASMRGHRSDGEGNHTAIPTISRNSVHLYTYKLIVCMKSYKNKHKICA